MSRVQLPAVIKREIPNAKLPINYEAAKRAIRECADFDQLKDLTDKAVAMASYAKESRDESMLNDAKRIILRAKSRLGELLREIPRSRALRSHLRNKGEKKGKNPRGPMFIPNPESRTGVARRLGLSATQAGHAMRMGAVPEDVREALIEQTPPASQWEIAGRSQTRGLFSEDHRLRFSENYHLMMSARNGTGGGSFAAFMRFAKKHDARDVASGVELAETDRLREHVAFVADWLDTLEQHLPKVKS